MKSSRAARVFLVSGRRICPHHFVNKQKAGLRRADASLSRFGGALFFPLHLFTSHAKLVGVQRPSASTPAAATQQRTTPAPLYAEVALPLRLQQTFTYRLPEALREDARAGARVLVPFGRKLSTAYVVALHDEIDPADGLEESELKEGRELLDAEPLLTPEVLDITSWISDYTPRRGRSPQGCAAAGLNSTSSRSSRPPRRARRTRATRTGARRP